MSRSKTLVLGEEDFARQLAEGLSVCGPVEVIPWGDGLSLWSLVTDEGDIQLVIADKTCGFREFKGNNLVLALKPGFVLPPYAVEAMREDDRVISLAELSSRLGIDYPSPAVARKTDRYPTAGEGTLQAAVIVDGEGLESAAPTRAVLLCAAEMARRGTAVTVFYRSLALAGGENDRYHNLARDAGVGFVRYTERPSIERGPDERLSLVFVDSSLSDRYRLRLPVDLLVLAEEYQPPTLQGEVFKLLGWKKHLGGYNLDDNNFHYWRHESPRRGLYWITPESWREQLEAVVDCIKDRDRAPSGAVRPSRVIDPFRCQLCLTCRRVCPHGAIEIYSYSDRQERGMMYQAAARIDEELCFDCGICQQECPAMAIGSSVDGSGGMVLGVGAGGILIPLKEAGLTDVPYRITAFACVNSGYPAVRAAAAEGEMLGNGREIELIAEVRVRTVNCAGDVDMLNLWGELSQGADGLIVWSCQPGGCQHLRGNQRTGKRMARMEKEMGKAGGKEPPLLFQATAPNHSYIISESLNRLILRIKQNRGGG